MLKPILLGPMARLQRNTKRIKTGKAPRYPTLIEAEYAGTLSGFNEAMRKSFLGKLAEILRRTEAEYVRDSFVDDIIEVYDELRRQWTISNASALLTANRLVQRINANNRKAIHTQMTEAMGIDIVGMVHTEQLEAQLHAAVQRNVSLIRSIPEQNLYKIEQIIYQETVTGATAQNLVSQINKVYDVGEARARLIARDQTAKLNSALTKARHEAMGVRAYVWRTVGDERVREGHDDRNSKVYAYNPKDVGETLSDGRLMRDPKANSIGNPGEDFRCRCIAEPVLELDRMGLVA